MGRLDGKVAIVTGASRRLGKAIAELFAAEGAAVAVVARTEQQWDARMPARSTRRSRRSNPPVDAPSRYPPASAIPRRSIRWSTGCTTHSVPSTSW